MFKNLVFSSLMTISTTFVWSQQNVFVTIQPTFNGQPLNLSQPLNQTGTNFLLDHFDYYLSDIQLTHDGGQVMEFTNQVFLVEPTSFTIYLGFLDVTTIEQFSASVGVPPNLNTSSGSDAIDITQYPSNHPLSFQEPSMYWGWTSGYMHMIIGGNCDVNSDGTYETLFELHNLGDANYRGFTLPVVQTQTSSEQIDIYLNCQVDQWIKDIPLQTAGVSHGTTGLNMEIMKNVETEPVFILSQTADYFHHPERRGEVWISSTDAQPVVNWRGVEGLEFVQFVDVSGRIISTVNVFGYDGQMTCESPVKGIFFVRLLDENLAVIQSVKCML